MEKFDSFEKKLQESDAPVSKKITRREALKSIVGGIIGGAFLGKKRAEAAITATQESREQTSNVLQFNRLRSGVEREIQSRLTLDDEAKEQAKKELEALRQQFGSNAMEFVQRLVMENELAQADPDASPENKIKAGEKLEFVSKVFNNKDLETLFKSKLALNLEELRQNPDANRGFLSTTISLGDKDIDTIILYAFGRPAAGTSGAHGLSTAEKAAQTNNQFIWQQQIEPQFSRRWARINTVPPSNDFQFSVPIRSGLPEWENESIFLVEAYGKTKK